MKFTNEEIIKQFKKVHGDKYDYSKVEYENTDAKVIIICSEHGEFQQAPYKHINGQKCSKCSGNAKLNLTTILKSFYATHGDKYDYSLVNYTNVDSKIRILCNVHGEFLQTPYVHKKGSGCPKCFGAGLSKEEIIEQFKKIHGNKYNYSKIEKLRARDPVIIICPDHGEFKQRANSHKRGAGCPKCSGTMKYKLSELIEEFTNVHGNKYDYSKVLYSNINSKVIIICPEHGEFKQIPNIHKQGSGCPKCVGQKKTMTKSLRNLKKYMEINIIIQKWSTKV